jgi:oxalate decarboxylase/phosphoglucose isomerase-like protein (cupin superfamily)
MLPPHFHPRGANFVVAISGNTTTYMYGENGAQTITETLTPMKATIFPQASLHMMVNNGTKPFSLPTSKPNSIP